MHEYLFRGGAQPGHVHPYRDVIRHLEVLKQFSPRISSGSVLSIDNLYQEFPTSVSITEPAKW
jgi:hypothetical protein